MEFYTNKMDLLINGKIKPNLKAIYNLRIKGMKDKHIAKFLGCSEKQFLKAMEECEELKEVYEDATLLLCSEMRNVVISRALGKDGKLDSNGREVGPDANLALRVLEKLDPAFSKKEEITVELRVEDYIKALNRERRANIEEAKVIENKNLEKGYKII